MGRILQLTPSYALSFSRLGSRLSTSARLALRAELKRLEAEQELPATAHFEGLLSPPSVGAAWVRKVRDAELWLLYRFDGIHVSMREVTRREPTRIARE